MGNLCSAALGQVRPSIRHDRTRISFRRSAVKLNKKTRATLANGIAERMVQTLTHALKMYVADVNQQDWDEYEERQTFALNTAHDRVRGDTPSYLIHGWDPRSTLEAALPLGGMLRMIESRGGGYIIRRLSIGAPESRPSSVFVKLFNPELTSTTQTSDRMRSKLAHRCGYMKVGYARNISRRWHGPFRVVGW